MAGDIKKQLIIKASLDSAELKKQVAELKRELKTGFKLNSQDTQSIKAEFKNIAKSFAEDLKKAIQSSGVASSATTPSGPKVGRSSLAASGNEKAWKERDKELAAELQKKSKILQVEQREQQKIRELATRGNEKAWKDHEKALASELQKKLKIAESEKVNQEKITKAREREEARIASLKEKERKKDLDQNVKNLETLRQKKVAHFVETSKLDRSFMATAGRTMGMSPEAARGMAGAAGRAGSAMGGLGGAGAAITGAALGQLQLRSMALERQQRFAADIESGDYISSQARQAGRDEFSIAKGGGALGGALGGAALGAKLGAFGGPLGALAGGAIGGVVGGIGGYMAGSNMQGDYRAQQVAFGGRAFDQARGMNPQMLDILSAGATGNQMSQAVGGGSRFGFGSEQSMAHFQQTQAALGSRAGMSTGLQGLQRRFGVGVGQSAGLEETLTGLGTGGAASDEKRVEKLFERAVTSGMDKAKLPAFTQTVRATMSAVAGLSRVDESSLVNSLLASAQTLGQGNITEQTLGQAAAIQQQISEEAKTIQGVSGGANIINTLDALKEAGIETDFATAAKLATLAPDQVAQFAPQILKDASEEQLEKFIPLQREGQTRGTLGMFEKSLGSREDAMTAEILSGRGGYADVDARSRVIDASTRGPNIPPPLLTRPDADVMETQQGRLARAEAELDVTKFQTGLSLFEEGIGGATKGLSEFNKQLLNSIEKLKGLIQAGSPYGVNKEGSK
jgi:hypothetical protein